MNRATFQLRASPSSSPRTSTSSAGSTSSTGSAGSDEPLARHSTSSDDEGVASITVHAGPRPAAPRAPEPVWSGADFRPGCLQRAADRMFGPLEDSRIGIPTALAAFGGVFGGAAFGELVLTPEGADPLPYSLLGGVVGPPVAAGVTEAAATVVIHAGEKLVALVRQLCNSRPDQQRMAVELGEA